MAAPWQQGMDLTDEADFDYFPSNGQMNSINLGLCYQRSGYPLAFSPSTNYVSLYGNQIKSNVNDFV